MQILGACVCGGCFVSDPTFFSSEISGNVSTFFLLFVHHANKATRIIVIHYSGEQVKLAFEMSFQLFKCLFSLPASERLHKRNCENFSTHQNKSQHQFLLTVNHSFYCCFDVIKNILHIDVQAKKNSCCLHFRKKGVTSLHASLVQCYTEIMR